MTAIDVDSVSKAFGDVRVLEDVSLTVEEGSFVGLVGPNGAGKSTLLRTISAALAPDAGTVTVDGSDVHVLSSRASSRLISVVPQDTTLSFAFDVRSVVEMGRTPYRSRFSSPTPEDRRLVDEALERTGVAAFADRSIENVSGGERQRVILARAIAQDTPVVLLDEPTASLDINHQVETLELVADLVADGKTVVAAIHDLDLAARYCDSLAVLADGRILETGAPESVLTSALLERAFDANATVATNPVTGTPAVTALPSGIDGGSLGNEGEAESDALAVEEGFRALERESETGTPDRVHLVGTGSTAADVLARLASAPVDVSVGPVTSGDALAETARALDLDPILVEPFEPVDGRALTEVETAIGESDATVVADVHVSSGNQLLLESLADAAALVVVETRPFDERNSAGEGARDRYEEIRQRAVTATPSTVARAIVEARRSTRDERADRDGDDGTGVDGSDRRDAERAESLESDDD